MNKEKIKYILGNIKFELVCLWDDIYYMFKKTKKEKLDPLKFKFMCFNVRRDVYKDGINSWQNRKNAVIKMFETEQPSIVCMQEVVPHIAKFISSKMNYRYDFYGRDRFLNSDLTKCIIPPVEGLAIMYDRNAYACFDKGVFWLSENPNKPSFLWDGIKDMRVCVYVGLIDKTTGESFYVFNGHHHHKADHLLKLSADFTVTKIKQIAGNIKSYFCGDLNDNWNSPNMKAYDDFYKYKTGADNGKTFCGFRDTTNRVIDAIYYNDENRKIEVLNTNNLEKYGVKYISDHYPVVIY